MDQSDVPQNRKTQRANVLMQASLELSGTSLPVKLRNLSSEGALVESDKLPVEGSAVVFRRGDLAVPGRIAWTKTRQENAAFLDAHLEGVVVPPVADNATHVYHQYTIRVAEGRDEVVRRLREEFQVGSGVYYPIPNHRLESLKGFAPGLDLPETERAAAEVLSLPVHPSLGQGDLDRIVEAVNTVVQAGA